jgi:predicted porin
MRKLLLGTTAVVGAALIGATTAAAQTAPTVRIAGYFDFSLGFINDDADSNLPAITSAVVVTSPTGSTAVAGSVGNRGSISSWDFRADTEIHVIVEGKAANGLTYGARIEFEMDAIGLGSAGTAFNTDEMFATISGPGFGTVRLGDTDSAAGIMQVRPARYTGFNGPRVNWVNQGGTRYMFAGMNDGADNTKIVYMSPQFAGFDIGLSFALNGGEGEREVRGVGVDPNSGAVSLGNLQRGRIDRENEFTGALRYRGTFGAVGVAAGFAFSLAQAPQNNVALGAIATRTDAPNAYSVGATVTFAGLNIGGEYTWGSYTGSGPGNTGTVQGRRDSNHYLLGASYTIADVTVTANFGRGEQQVQIGTGTPADIRTHSSRLYGLGAAYTLAPGWSAYAYFESIRDNNFPTTVGGVTAGNRRNTNAFVLGTNLTF